jgi:acetyltransferase-like isoleucine patch superfamily enzyme
MMTGLKFFAVVLSASLGMVIAPSARAQVTSCSGVLTGSTIHRNVFVPDGATCLLHDVRVVGNVLVGSNAALQLGADTNIGGNILADRCNYVEEVELTGVTPTPIFIGGNVEINNCTVGGSLGSPGFTSVTVRGNLSCENNSGCGLDGAEIGGNVHFINNSGGGSQIFNATIGGNVQVNQNSAILPGSEVAVVVNSTVGGNVQVLDNSGPQDAGVAGNVIGGNLRCQGNTPGVNDDNIGPNTVDGKKLGQCAGL